MADLLIRDVPDEVVAGIDAAARRRGLSRSEFLRRALAATTAESRDAVSVGDLAEFADTFADLNDPDVMGEAWR